MTKTLLLITALTLGGMASAQTVRLNAPDSTVVELGITTPQNTQFGAQYRPNINLYGNVTLSERLALTSNGGSLWGTLQVGNSWQDYNRLYVDGRLDYNVRNVTLYGAVRQGFYSMPDGFSNQGTSFRIGTQVRF